MTIIIMRDSWSVTTALLGGSLAALRWFRAIDHHVYHKRVAVFIAVHSWISATQHSIDTVTWVWIDRTASFFLASCLWRLCRTGNGIPPRPVHLCTSLVLCAMCDAGVVPPSIYDRVHGVWHAMIWTYLSMLAVI